MAHRTVGDQQFFDAAFDLFRTYGFEGVSLSRLASATGLEKASLYHRFPGGKDEIAMAVVNRALEWFDAEILAPLKGEGSLRKRVSNSAERLGTFYQDGKRSCITDVLSLPGGNEELHAALKTGMQGWIRAFAQVARESGFPPAAARARAEEAVVKIQGSLVLARVLGDPSQFQRTIRSLIHLLIAD